MKHHPPAQVYDCDSYSSDDDGGGDDQTPKLQLAHDDDEDEDDSDADDQSKNRNSNNVLLDLSTCDLDDNDDDCVHDATNSSTSENDDDNGNITRIKEGLRQLLSYDHECFVLSARVATSMTLASLFTLAFPSDRIYPNAQWIVTSAGVVSWQSYSDTASAVKKAVERSTVRMQDTEKQPFS